VALLQNAVKTIIMIKKIFKAFTNRQNKYTDPSINSELAEFEVNNWTISQFVIDKLVPVVGVHPFPLNELMLMTAAVCKFKPQLVFEWGTNIGKSARIFYEITKAFDIKSEIHSIDLPDDVFHNEHPQENRGVMVRGIREVTLHQADGLQRSSEIIEKNKINGNILFFVDGDHSYESVKRELGTILKKWPGAKILLHDTFNQSATSGYNTGPFRAIQDVLKEINHPYKVVSTNMGLPGMTLIY
jgi:cephalosporin hydroxylase